MDSSDSEKRSLTSEEDEQLPADQPNRKFKTLLNKTKQWVKGSPTNSPQPHDETPLHKAVQKDKPCAVLQLLEKGYNVNALDKFNRTPLHYSLSLQRNSFELFCMLLSYGGDFMAIDNEEKDTPVSYACTNDFDRMHNAAIVLIDYFDEPFLKSVAGVKTFLAIAKNRCSVAVKMVKAGGGVAVDSHDEGLQMNALYLSIKYKSAELFKLLWPKLDQTEILVNLTGLNHTPEYSDDPYFLNDPSPVPFIIQYLQEAAFSKEEWVECLYILLSSTVGEALIENCINYRPLHRRPNEHYFIQELLEAFSKNEIETDDRISIIYMCVSLGAVVNYHEINTAFQLYGFNGEVEALLCGVKSYDLIQNSEVRFLPLPMYILGCERSYDPIFINKLYHREATIHNFKKKKDYYSWYPMNDFDHLQECNYLLNSLGYFALSENFSKKLRESVKLHLKTHKEVCEKLDTIPYIPSLVELSRNTVRLFIKNTYKCMYPYQFHDRIHKLELPAQIKDIIRFKTPIY